MNKIIYAIALVGAVTVATIPNYSTLAVVTLSGAALKVQDNPMVEKYERKDCPICHGKGWYLSGDGLAKIDCQYCEE